MSIIREKQTFQELLIKTKSSELQNDYILKNESIIQIQYSQSLKLQKNLIKTFKNLKNKPQSNIFNQILKKSNKYASCLLSYAQTIVQHMTKINQQIKENQNQLALKEKTIHFPYLSLCHHSDKSQSVLLAAYIRLLQKSVVIVTNNISQWQSILTNKNQELNPSKKVQQYLQKQNIAIRPLTVANEQQQMDYSDLSHYQFIIYDIFNTNPMKYQPFLMKNLNNNFLIRQDNVIVYYSHNQLKQFQKVSEHLKCIESVFPFQLNFKHAIEIIKVEKSFDSILLSFLDEQKNHPQKQDVIIFYKSQKYQSLSKYLIRLQQQLKSHKIQKFVQLITGASQNLLSFANKIFIVQSSKQLQEWNYSYENVLYVFDAGFEEHYYLDYKTMCYIYTFKPINSSQMNKRISFIGNYQPGRYFYINQVMPQQQQVLNENNKGIFAFEKDISNYVYGMILNGYEKFILDRNSQRVSECISILQNCKLIKNKQQNYVSTKSEDQQFQFMDMLNKSCLNPIHLSIFQKILDFQEIKQNNKLKNLILMTFSLINCKQQVRKQKKIQSKYQKPSGAWRHSGYLHSFLQIMTKYEYLLHIDQQLQSNNKKNSIRKKTSQMAELNQDLDLDPFGHLGDLYDNAPQYKKNINEMTVAQYLKANEVNQTNFLKFFQELERLREALSVQRVKIQLEDNDVQNLMAIFLDFHKLNIAFYTGSSRTGYMLSGMKKGMLPHKNSLLSQYNEKPRFLIVLKLFQQNGKNQILLSNQLSESTYISILGKIPLFQKKSHAQAQIQFHGIGSVLFQNIWGKYKYLIQEFEQNNQCYIDSNEQMALILIYCTKNKQKQVKQKFQKLLDTFKQQLLQATKPINYIGSTSIVVGAGGIGLDLIKGRYLNKCLLGNLDIQCTVEDLHQIFDEFFRLKSISMSQDVLKQFSKQKTMKAEIEFNNQKQYYRFYEYYNKCMLYNRQMKIIPIYGQKIESAASQRYLRVKWFAWKSLKKGLVQFQTEKQAEIAFQKLGQNPIIDEKKVIVKRQKACQLLIDDLSATTDQIALQRQFSKYGDIKSVQILKLPTKQQANDQQLLQMHIKALFGKQRINFKINPIKKKKNGLRTAKVIFIDGQNIMDRVMLGINNKLGIMGVAKTYTTKWVNKSFLIPKGCNDLYQKLIKQTRRFIGNTLKHKIVQLNEGNNYLVVKGVIQHLIRNFQNRFTPLLNGQLIKLNKQQTKIVLSELGLRNLLDIEEKFSCKFIADSIKKQLKLIAPREDYGKIQKEIKQRLSQQFIYRVNINNKALKCFKENPEKYHQIEKNHKLKYIQLDQMGKTLLLEGSALNIQNSISYLLSFIQSLSNKSEQQMINADCCLICCQNPSRPYRLQACGHRFCLNCLYSYIQSALGDVSMFPLKCPHCLKNIVLQDIEKLIQPQNQAKWLGLIMNIYVGKNSEVYTFCYTPGCKQISRIDGFTFKCDLCNISFCLKCKQNMHPGLSCQQARLGLQVLFKKFMQSNNVRKCPNISCGMPIFRQSGCFRVTCTRCSISMCFKCPANQMTPYKTAGQCYNHLSEAHGGYF